MESSKFCPSCGAARLGSFRFCRSCAFDFDLSTESPVAATRPIAPVESAPSVAGSAATPHAQAPWYKRRNPVLTVAGVVVALVLIGQLNPRQAGSVADASASPGPTATPTVTPLPVTTVTPTPRPTATPAPTVPTFAAITLKGTGNKVPKFSIPQDVPAIATITYSGSGNFAVWSIAADGSTNDLLVNSIGKYAGTVILDFDPTLSAHSVAMKVEASGAWTIAIKPLGSARAWYTGGPLAGKSDDVVLVFPPPTGLKTSLITHDGSSNFAVWTFSGSGGLDLLVNEIGNYSGEDLLPDGTVLLQITADGAWSFSPPR